MLPPVCVALGVLPFQLTQTQSDSRHRVNHTDQLSAISELQVAHTDVQL